MVINFFVGFDKMRCFLQVLLIVSSFVVTSCHINNVVPVEKPSSAWKELKVIGAPHARHEAGFTTIGGKLYLMGGRGIKPTSIFDPKTNSWSEGATPPIELHHFQPVPYNGKIYIVGAMTGPWPNETPVGKVLVYDPKEDNFEWGDDIPEHRQRGSAGAIAFDDKIYIVGGIVNGHLDGYKPWLDEYDPQTGEWSVLPDAPHARDHFQAALYENKLYAFGGRTTSKKTQQDISLTIAHGNVYDFAKQLWLVPTTLDEIPTQRAGTSALVWQNQLIVIGGESDEQIMAHNEVEAFDLNKRTWTKWPALNLGRHGTGAAIIDGYVYTASGAGNRGGEPELLSVERLQLPAKAIKISQKPPAPSIPIYRQWHTVTLNFDGPNVSETDAYNPFLHYKLWVKFRHLHSQQSFTVPGYYAADGNAAETSAMSGDLWQVKFNPPKQGEWEYEATLYSAENIAIKVPDDATPTINLSDAIGSFLVTPTDKQGNDFRANGRLIAKNSHFMFENTGKHWLKVGANSPENLLGYTDFDNTYVIPAKAREGEAAPNKSLHQYTEHLSDWVEGDPQWGDKKGRSLIGAINYLSSQGMNSVYFLTMNILGDGKDVWPYLDHKDFTRFDVSKLAQWEVLFEHMQQKGILLHMVVQETENEMLLDKGDTGPLRKLYFNELIARFGHHLGLVWNLGEENGFADWTPNAQNTAQRKAMSSYLKQQDPFNHPVLLHTHSHEPTRGDILNPLLGFKDIDGLSLQVDNRKQVYDVIQYWTHASIQAQHPWLITMDEIGMWHTGALPDSLDSAHHSLQKHVLWGGLLSGAAGVEWYFGAKHPHNDLTSEDWRQRDNLWRLTKIAKQFFEAEVAFWNRKPCNANTNADTKTLCANFDGTFVIYLDQKRTLPDNLFKEASKGTYDIFWFDPAEGGALQRGNNEKLLLNEAPLNLGSAPKPADQDWVVMLKKRSLNQN
ncbi:DUF5060 domain-containing protein [Aliiglaciecola sp. M165]|uniref:Kelch repeat-containing protein n=1 Tax=Aliiglaciecola sp. M165 TaxID=2593649 RepID=UPI00163DB706|nr:DUF5060 domain-containing protein [Aliiglaciecola sp. M165]